MRSNLNEIAQWNEATFYPPNGMTGGGMEAEGVTKLENMSVAATAQSRNGCG